MAVELKKGQKINLQKKRNEGLGEILINLNWKQPAKKGFFGRTKAIDLDLGCLYELENGTKGVVQALGNAFGSLTHPPYIALDGDDRTGSSQGGENLRINGAEVSKIRRVLVFTYIYEGAANWQEADGVVTIRNPGSSEIIVRMDEYGSKLPMCAIALMENYMGQTLSVEKIVKFFPSHVEMDREFGWNMNWVPGTKD